MKKIIIGICFVFISWSAIQAQYILLNPTNRTGLRLHLNAGLYHIPTISPFLSDFPDGFNYMAPGVTMYWQKERRYTEFGLADWYLKSIENDLGAKESRTYWSLRFERGWRMNATDKKLQFFIGYALQPHFETLNFEPSVTTPDDFSRNGFAFGIQTEFILKFAFQLSDSWTLDLSAPLMFTDFSLERINIENPAWTEQQQQQGGFDLDMVFGDLSLRLGISKAF